MTQQPLGILVQRSTNLCLPNLLLVSSDHLWYLHLSCPRYTIVHPRVYTLDSSKLHNWSPHFKAEGLITSNYHFCVFHYLQYCPLYWWNISTLKIPKCYTWLLFTSLPLRQSCHKHVWGNIKVSVNWISTPYDTIHLCYS